MIDGWKSCENCGDAKCSAHINLEFQSIGCCTEWKPIPCPRCGGALSTTREHNGRKYRHCYACHAEFFER